jgi:hypothetical protein
VVPRVKVVEAVKVVPTIKAVVVGKVVGSAVALMKFHCHI